jgi:putative Holliday junction resolvase
MSIDSQNLPETSRILAIDFGKAKVGLAMADSETKIAFGYGTLDNDKNLIAKIVEIIQKEGVGKVIIGKLGQWKDVNSAEIEKLAEELKNKTGAKVEFHEEMFTTKMAQDNLKEAGAKDIKRLDNQEAARVILESWLGKTMSNNQ